VYHPHDRQIQEHALRRPRIVCTALVLATLLPTLAIHANDASPPATAPTARSAPTIVTYQPGVRIDWTRRQVEIDAKVILRQGAIELFACSPRTREHESIVCIQARPLHVYQAMGLVGLVPGHPTQFDIQTERIQPATGESIEIQIRHTVNDAIQTEPIENWLRHANTRRPLERLDWVFAGSLPAEGGGMTADLEGTVIALVDFSSALIALPQHHTDSNDALWLEPNTQAIPALGTPCTLLVRQGPLRIHLDATGRLRLNRQPCTLATVAATLLQTRRDGDTRPVELRIDPSAPPTSERLIRNMLRLLGVPTHKIICHRSAVSSALSHDPNAFASWLNHRWAQQPPNEKQPRTRLADIAQKLGHDLRKQVTESHTQLKQLIGSMAQPLKHRR